MSNSGFPIRKDNLRIILIGLAINVIGYLAMIGGGSDDPNKFDGDAMFSTMRITIAPMLIVAGFVVIGYGIMKKPAKKKTEE